jgi:hypothetical protein
VEQIPLPVVGLLLQAAVLLQAVLLAETFRTEFERFQSRLPVLDRRARFAHELELRQALEPEE